MVTARQTAFSSVDKQFLSERIAESKAIIESALKEAHGPLIIQFSGGRDSVAMVGLVSEVTKHFACGYMVSGIEFHQAVDFASKMARKLEIPLLFSYPGDHLGGFFDRLEKLRTFPTVRSTWCQRDLKVRPQAKMLHKLFGKQPLYKLVGVRKWESNRRKVLYPLDRTISADTNVAGDFLVYPMLNWTDSDVVNYLESTGLPTSQLYRKYGVSGCYWCPFYQPSIYRRILAGEPKLLDRFIEAEETYGPSVSNFIYLRDIKAQLVGDACSKGGTI